MKIPVGVSARHVHLTREHLDILFGNNYDLTKFKDLSQQGQYASNELVIIKTEKAEIKNVRVLGPVRNYTQVEISRSDAIKLGLNPPVRDSGVLDDSSSITIIGPKGRVDLTEGCIIANRHIHLTNEDMQKYGLENIDKVKVKVRGVKGGILDNVFLKISDSYSWELHIDVDDANAHLIKQGDLVMVIKDEK